MRRLLAVVTIIVCLSMPVVAGHVPINGAYCAPCNNVTCICGPGEQVGGQSANKPVQDGSKKSDGLPVNFGPEVLMGLLVMLMLLRYKA